MRQLETPPEVRRKRAVLVSPQGRKPLEFSAFGEVGKRAGLSEDKTVQF